MAEFNSINLFTTQHQGCQFTKLNAHEIQDLESKNKNLRNNKIIQKQTHGINLTFFELKTIEMLYSIINVSNVATHITFEVLDYSISVDF